MSATTSSMVFANKPSRLPGWVNTLLVIVLGWALAVLSMKLIPAPVTNYRTNVVAAPTSVANRVSDPAKLAQMIAQLHVFGDATAKPVVDTGPKPEVVVQKSKLQLQLAGVFAYTPADKAIAIISQGSKEQSAYGIGDKIVGEVTLEEVHQDHIIINNRGKNERIDLPENVQPIAMGSLPQATVNNNAGQAANTGQGSNQQAGPIDLPTSPGALRDTLARNPSMLGRIVAAEPYQENGKLVGYRITPKQNPEILEAQGILAGDVITRVNNIQLNSQKQGIRALRNAVKAQALEVTVLRDGAEIPLSISLAQ